jgi:hypothetical protein
MQNKSTFYRKLLAADERKKTSNFGLSSRSGIQMKMPKAEQKEDCDCHIKN